jgi:hypothetical protein
MRIIDRTHIADKGKIRRLIQFARPKGISGFNVVIDLCFDGFHGAAYFGGRWSFKGECLDTKPRSVSQYIEIKIMPKTHGVTRFPYTWRQQGAYIKFTVRSEAEVVLYLLAHEMRHVWQAAFPKAKRAPGSRGIFSERDADLYAIGVIRRWRMKGVAKTIKAGIIAQ